MSISDDLRISAQRLGGARTFDFCQGKAFKVAPKTVWSTPTKDWADQGKMYRRVLQDNSPMGGVCATVCAFWIVFHAIQREEKIAHSFTRDRSVWDYLFKDGELNTGAAMNIIAEQLQVSRIQDQSQAQLLANLMSKFKIKRRIVTTSGSPISNKFIPLSHSTICQCASAITKIGGYKLILLKKELGGSVTGHVVSAWSDGRDVLFLDPNYGEFWLPNITSFNIWLASFFARTYLRDNRYKSMFITHFAYNTAKKYRRILTNKDMLRGQAATYPIVE